MVEISTHCFHGMYLFDRDNSSKKFVDSKGPTHLLSEWPIFDRIPMGKRDGGSFKEYSDFKNFLELESEESRPDEAICNNFFKINRKDFHKIRGAFHGLLNGLSFSHELNLNLNGSSSGVNDRTCCKQGAATATAVYEEGGGHCCDRAIFGFFVDDNRVGTINLNNGGDCGSRRSGPFTISASVIEKRSVPVKITCENNGDCHDGITRIEIKDSAGGDGGSISLSEGERCIEFCVQPEDDFSEELCCCPPRHVKEKDDQASTDAGNELTCPEFVESEGYQCERTHSKDLTVDFNFKGVKIFELKELKSLIGAERFMIISDIQPILKDSDPVSALAVSISEGPSSVSSYSSSNGNFEISADISSVKLYDKEWEFIGDGAYKSELDKSSISNFHIVKDPVLGYEQEALGFAYSFTSPLEAEGDFLKQKINFSNNRFHNIKIDSTSQNLGHSDVYSDDVVGEGVCSYKCSAQLGNIFYSPLSEEYYFIVNFNSLISSSDMDRLYWDAGDYRGANTVTGPDGAEEDDKDRSDFAPVVWEEGQFEFDPSKSPLKFSTDAAFFLDGSAFSTEAWNSAKAESKVWISKSKTNIELVLGESTITKQVEFFEFEKKSIEHKEAPPEDEEEQPNKCEITIDAKITWKNNISLGLSCYKDFSNQLLIPTI